MSAEQFSRLEALGRLTRHWILTATTEAGSGHPTSSLSATELMVGLLFGGAFRYDPENPGHPNNDRLIFSKGHATPLLYALWLAAGKVTEAQMLTYRRFGSVLEGHPSVAFPYVDAATGSLGQGLAIGVGLALNARLDRLPYRTYVLLGDGEMAEGSQWESIQLAAHYKLDNLVGVLDVNRLGQCGATMYEHDLEAYRKRVGAFGWETLLVDGHALPEILEAYERAGQVRGRPVMIIARTVKGRGVSFLEDENGWHGKALDRGQLAKALAGLGEVDTGVRGEIRAPEDLAPVRPEAGEAAAPSYELGSRVPTRNAYGRALVRLASKYPRIVCLDAEVSNSTKSGDFKEVRPERFFEMYVAEQNMVGAALGLACRGKIPFVSTFAAFLSRAFDQVRMSQYSEPDLKFVGSHAGVSIGYDGPSQMGLEDLAMFRTILGGVVLYPCDAVSTERLVEEMANQRGIAYLRTTREGTPVIYGPGERFPIGGCKVLRESRDDVVTVVGAGVTLHEALAAGEELAAGGVAARVVDLYSVKPVDAATLRRAAAETGAVVTVEDHYAEGGLGEAVLAALAGTGTPVRCLAVRKKPRSGAPAELLDYEEISAAAIVRAARDLIGPAPGRGAGGPAPSAPQPGGK